MGKEKAGITFLIFFFMMVGFLSCSKSVSGFEPAVRQAVEQQMQTYPESTLKDIYKNFFQDKYGPGHIISDTTAAGNYVRRELASMQRSDGELIEPTGWEGNFYRVNLSVIKDGIIPYEVFFDAFVRSVNGIQPPSIEEWTNEWKQIESIIAKMPLSLSDYEEDRKAIEEQLAGGEYVGHHSRVFEESYSPHYRIISKDIFEKELRPLFK